MRLPEEPLRILESAAAHGAFDEEQTRQLEMARVAIRLKADPAPLSDQIRQRRESLVARLKEGQYDEEIRQGCEVLLGSKVLTPTDRRELELALYGAALEDLDGRLRLADELAPKIPDALVEAVQDGQMDPAIALRVLMASPEVLGLEPYEWTRLQERLLPMLEKNESARRHLIGQAAHFLQQEPPACPQPLKDFAAAVFHVDGDQFLTSLTELLPGAPETLENLNRVFGNSGDFKLAVEVSLEYQRQHQPTPHMEVQKEAERVVIGHVTLPIKKRT
ncbi:MAG: hypothetical protein HY319_10380 [Armatimonadetes bacterium]|nr:hypothetical protein [Armatimonadota bacterium]